MRSSTTLSVRAAAALAFASLAGRPASAQELQNPGFEGAFTLFDAAPTCPAVSGDVATWWFDNSCWPGNESASVAYARSDVAPHGGASAQAVTVGGGIFQLAQSVELVAGRRYAASIRLRAAAPMDVQLLLRQQGPPYTSYLSTTAELTADWETVSVEGFAATTPGFFMLRSEDVGSFEMDDASLSWTPAAQTLPARPVDEAFFGMHLHGGFGAWPRESLEVSGVRIWDSEGAQWANVHLAPGVFDWTTLDAHVARAQERGAEVLFVLGRTPRWASARPDEPSPYGPGQAAEPSSLDVWSEWVAAVATRYGDQIDAYEIWNEPNDTQFYSGAPEMLVTLAQEAHAILKGLDPEKTVVSPSPYDLGYLDDYLGLGGGAFADVIGYHFYLIGTEPEYLFESYIPSARLIMEEHGVDGLPLWDTEAGWWNGPALPVEVGVGYVARSNLLNWAGGADRFYFYSWDPGSESGVDLAVFPDYRELTPAGLAYQESARWMLGARMTDIAVDDQGTWTLELTRPDGDRAWAVWNPSASSVAPVAFDTATLPGARFVRDLDGSVAGVPAGTLAVDARPRLLEQESLVGREECACEAMAPCGNASFDSGCVNSTGLGARLVASGSSSLWRDDLVLRVVDVPPGQAAVVFMGQGLAATPLGGGVRCASEGGGAGLLRFPVTTSGADGTFRVGPGLAAFAELAFDYGNGAIDRGETWRFQAWFRDAPNACGQPNNLSSVLAITFY